MIGEVTLETVTYATPPHRFEAGTPPIVEAIGLGAALRYMMGLGRVNIRAHEETLRDYAHERLSRLNSIRIFGNAPGKGASSPSRCGAPMRTTSPRSSTDRAWR